MDERLKNFHILRWEEMPAIALYLDQVLIIIEDVFKDITPEGEKVITATIINNYVKQKVIAPTVKKKYSKEHLADLIMITALKRVLSTSEIVLVLQDLKNGKDTQAAYGVFCAAIESCLRGQDSKTADSGCPEFSMLALKSLVNKIQFDMIAELRIKEK